MENFIIVLISIGFVVYNIYKNFKKELEKSKSRQPNVRPQTAPTVESTTSEKSKKIRDIKTKYIEPIHRPELPEEVKEAQLRKRQHQIQKPAPIKRTHEVTSDQYDFEFDLRQAVIQSVILERPYK